MNVGKLVQKFLLFELGEAVGNFNQTIVAGKTSVEKFSSFQASHNH